jgi:DNA-binding response OmpR family regulator
MRAWVLAVKRSFVAFLSHWLGVMCCASTKERYTGMPGQKVFGQKVLVVDDSWTELTMIATPLRNSGFDVITAVDGDEALEKVFREQPQCIVLDVVLPKQNGFQLCRKLKSLDASKHIPIILLTSKNTPLDRSWGMRQGADMYMTKPFNDDELIDSVRSLV